MIETKNKYVLLETNFKIC